jgi:hypothetical protein
VLTKVIYTTAGASAALLNSLDFSGTIGLGSILVGLLVTILAGGVNFRNRFLRDQIEGWKGNYEQSEAHVEQLTEQLTESHRINEQLRSELADARVVIERLQQLPNLERLVQLMSDIQERQEKRADGRHTELLAAIAAPPKGAPA